MNFINFNHLTHLVLILCSIFMISCDDEPNNVNMSNIPPEGIEYLVDYERPKSLWGFIDENTEIVIPEKYDVVRNFHNGKCAVNEGGLWYFIDKEGKKITPETYRACYNFHHGYARIQNWDGTYNFLNNNYKKVLSTDLHFAKDFMGSYAVIQESKGGPIKLLSTSLHKSMPYGAFMDGLQIDDVSHLSENYYKIKTMDGLRIYDLEQEEYVGGLFQSIHAGAEDEFIVKVENKMKILTRNLETKNKGFQSLTFHNGDIYTGIKDDIPTVIKNGNEIQIDSISYITYAQDSTFIYYLEDGLQGLMNYTFQTITPPIYEQIYTFHQSRAAYKRQGLWGFIDNKGRELTKPQYGLIWPTHDDFTRVMFRQGVGIIDRQFDIIVPPGLGELRDMHDERAAFREQIF